MALYNSEAVHGFPTGNLSLHLLNKINPNQIHFVSEIKLVGEIRIVPFSQQSFNELNKAVDAVKEGHYWGVAVIRYNFSQAIKHKYVIGSYDISLLCGLPLISQTNFNEN